jgi:4'-phosphopantetheinyl transferase
VQPKTPTIDLYIAAGVRELVRLAASDILDRQEMERAARFVFERDRILYRAAHVLLRRSLSRHVALDPATWRFLQPRGARPEMDPLPCPDGRGLRFNLSHTRGLVCCVVAWELEVGIDAEQHRRLDDLDALARHCFDPGEGRVISAAPQPQRTSSFYDYWTLKEAYLKATGIGLSAGLDRFGFRLGQDGASGIDLVVDPTANDEPADWRFALLRPGTEHSLAVAVRSAAAVRFRVHAEGLPELRVGACSADSMVVDRSPGGDAAIGK